jgi:hypothetical protein
VVTWIVVAVVVLSLLILGAAILSVLGRLTGLQRAARRLQLRQEQAVKLSERAGVLTETIAALQERAESTQQQVAVIKAGRGAR